MPAQFQLIQLKQTKGLHSAYTPKHTNTHTPQDKHDKTGQLQRLSSTKQTVRGDTAFLFTASINTAFTGCSPCVREAPFTEKSRSIPQCQKREEAFSISPSGWPWKRQASPYSTTHTATPLGLGKRPLATPRITVHQRHCSTPEVGLHWQKHIDWTPVAFEWIAGSYC